jgi:ABC-2 type transport system permease protein
MFRALFAKSFGDARWLLGGCVGMIFCLCWLLVYGASYLETSQFQRLLTEFFPDFVRRLFTVPLEFVTSPAGRVAAGYEHPGVLVVMSLWAIARGSESIAGGLAEGTLELVLAQPISRLSVLLAHAAVTVVGCVAIAMAAWCGTAVGVTFIKLETPVVAWPYVAAAGNLFAVGVFLAGATMLLGSFDRVRSRTVGLAIGFCAVEAILEIVSRQAPQFQWLPKTTFLSAYQPQKLVYQLLEDPSAAGDVLFDHYAVLLVLGLVGFTMAAAVFARRDLPAPL